MTESQRVANAHHLVLGELTDFLTGEIRADTHDERYRQKLARHLVQTLGFDPEMIRTRVPVALHAGRKQAVIPMDFLVGSPDVVWMMMRYAPGSLVTRRLPNLALSRVICPYQIPVVVTTNGEDAEIINGHTGRVEARGLDKIPSRALLMKPGGDPRDCPVPKDLREKAARIVMACEVDDACPCDTDICRIPMDGE